MVNVTRSTCILAVCLLACATARGQDSAIGVDAFVRWAAAHAMTLAPLDSDGSTDDLRGIDRLAQHARVIAVGESDHNVHEFLQVRRRILQRLVERGAIAAIAMETGLPEAREVDEWLAGNANDAPPFERLLHYGYGQDREMLEMLTWLHDNNRRAPRGRRVHFYGLDMARNGGGSLIPAIEPMWAYLDRVDPEYAGQSRARLTAIVRAIDQSHFSRSRPAYDNLSADERDTLRTEATALAKRFATERQRYLAHSTSDDYTWAARCAQLVRQTEEFLRDRDTPANPRDAAMAENLQWVLDREGRRGLVLLFAHNLHVARVPIEGPMVVARFGHPASVQTLGQIVARSLGSAYVTIGMAHDFGAVSAPTTHADPTAVDGVLARVGRSPFLLSLHDRRMPAQTRAWLTSAHLMRAVSTYVELRPAHAFDALIFVERIRPADPVSQR